MKFRINSKFVRWGITAFLVIAASCCFIYLVFEGSSFSNGFKTLIQILTPVLFGMLIAYILTPVLNFVEYRVINPIFNKFKIKESKKRNSIIRCIGIIITTVLFYVLIYTLFYMILSQIIPSISNIVSNFDTYYSNFTKWITQLFDDNPNMRNNVLNAINKYSLELEKFLNDTVLSKTSEFIMTVSLSVINVLRFLWDMIIGIIISVYLLASKEKFTGQIKKIIYAIFKVDVANIIVNNFRFVHKTFIGFVSGKVLDSIIIGILCFIGTSILKTPYAALISVTISVTNIIPFFGPFLGAIPSTILIFIVDPSHPLNCLYFIVFILALQQFDGNILGPKILGESTGLSGFWVIFSITFFGGLYGVFGMVVGVPILAIIFAAIRSIVNVTLRKKDLPTSSDDYVNVCMIDESGLQQYVPSGKRKRDKTQKKNFWFGEQFVCNVDEHRELFYTEPVNKDKNDDSKDKDDNNKK